MSGKRQREDASEDVFVYDENTVLSSVPFGITSLRIHNSVRKIPQNAFLRQRSLRRAEYEEGLQVIGEYAFMECTSLREQQFPSTLIEIGSYAFSSCEQLESVGCLPSSLKIVRINAFFRCYKLQSVAVPIDSTFRLEASTFALCPSLTYFRLPRGMVTIPESLFHNCRSLVDVNVPSSVQNIEGHAFFGCETLGMIELSAGLKTIGQMAFHSAGLKHFHCPVKVERIGNGVLAYCKSLESVILPPKLEVIAEGTFQGCEKLKDVSIPQSVVRVGELAFAGCGLIQLDLSQCNLTCIGLSAFAGCSCLKNIILPRTGLNRIEAYSFQNCESLTHLWVPPTVEDIYNGAFAGCVSLLSVEVPETLKCVAFVGQRQLGGELCGYESLVNIYIPPSHELDDVEEYGFMQEMKLGEAEGNYEELVDKLKGRFDNLPLHRACYFQSYHSLEENIGRIRTIVRDGPRSCEGVDFLGMTPFHILALSHGPCLNLFQELLSVSSLDIVKCRDVFGSTPLDYLCKNHSQAAEFATKSLLPNIMEPRISFLGLDRWRDEVMSGLEKAQKADATSLAAEVTPICQKLVMFERVEILSLLEMSVWRKKVEEEMATESDAREGCRINCGSSIVLAHVIPFLGDRM